MATASSSFVGTENPLSEGGVWTAPTTFWADMRKATGAGVANNGGVDCAKIYTGTTFTANQFSELVLNSIPTGGQLYFIYLHVRMNATAGLYQVTTAPDVGANILQLFRWSNAGASTQIGTDITLGANMAANDVMRLGVVGTTLTVTYNGTIVRTAVDATFATGQPGIGGWTQNSGSDVPFIKSWNAGDIAASDPPIQARTRNYWHSL